MGLISNQLLDKKIHFCALPWNRGMVGLKGHSKAI